MAAIADALQSGELTATELGDTIVDRTGPWAGELVIPAFNGRWPRWRAALDKAADSGALCFGRESGRGVTYTKPAIFVPGFRPADTGIALAWLVRTYLLSYGPASAANFAQWLVADRRWASELFGSLPGEIVPATIAGSPSWINSGSSPVRPPAGGRPEIFRLCSLTASSAGCGTTVVPGAGSRSRRSCSAR
jgi:hypothetical protein